jgi:hypothetical protein
VFKVSEGSWILNGSELSELSERSLLSKLRIALEYHVEIARESWGSTETNFLRDFKTLTLFRIARSDGPKEDRTGFKVSGALGT